MIDITLGVLCTIGAVAILIAAIGILRMPDFYLRLSVTVKAATLGGGLFLLSAAFYFPNEVSVTTKALAIIFFLVLTAPVAAHLIARRFVWCLRISEPVLRFSAIKFMRFFVIHAGQIVLDGTFPLVGVD